MADESKAMNYVMEASSGPHFSGRRLDSLPAAASPSPTPTPSSNPVRDFPTHKQPFVIGVSGGTASGKTTVCDMIIQQLHDHRVVLVNQVVEHGLGHLPFTEKQVVTPTGSVYTGVDFCKKLCGVSIIRSGESMENALRACCKGIKIGKILIHRHGDNGKQLIYEKLPKDICERHVLLLDPVLATGNSANEAIELLIQKGVPESHIIFLNLISAPEGIHCVCKRFPLVKIVTSEIDAGLNGKFQVIPGMGEFGDRYFGTDD
ncbi:UNVERIFIED_CONTAM: Uridine kinase-like protein 1, chloroplastic [Sesamum radiatum]|uniref:uracil phosphoribosyltransferase n=1 Tax=Sesamum radiatum TaxID=300843 RepID=A0AAW2VRZ6_SESRA